MKRISIIFVMATLIMVTIACGVSPQTVPIQTVISEQTVMPLPTQTAEVTETPVPTETILPTVMPEPTETTLPTETPEPKPTLDITTDFTTFKDESYILSYPKGWYSNAFAYLGFFATDAGLQKTYNTAQGIEIKEGAAVTVDVETRSAFGIGAKDTPVEGLNKVIVKHPISCDITNEPVATKVDGMDAATAQFMCTSASGAKTVVFVYLILKNDQAAGLSGLVALKSEDEYMPVVEAIINSFQFATAQ